jgi:acetyltransferase-like isoleucine patch superfamily enzyme
VRKHQPVCVVETTKASLEVEAPGAGALVQLYDEGAEVELGRRIALIAETADELAEALAGREQRRAAAPPPAVPASRKATRKALELAEQHGIDLDGIDKKGFITEKDVEALLAGRAGVVAPALLGGLSTEGVSFPASFHEDETVGVLEPAFLQSVRADPAAFRALPSEEKLAALREHGARVGEGVVLGEGVLVVAPRVILDDGALIGDGGTVDCAEVAAFGALAHFGPGLHLRCRRAYVGAGVWGGRNVRFGGGGHNDPWAILTVGDLAFVGEQAFVNVCRPVLIGREVFLTMRSIVVTHNIGHSVLEGYENRFAPVVLEDRAQVGMGTVVYAGCRVREGAIVASNSYVVSDIPAGKLAIGVPARVAGDARRPPDGRRQAELGRRMLDELRELLEARGVEVADLDGDHGFRVAAGSGETAVVFVPRLDSTDALPDGETVALTLAYAGGEPPAGTAVLDLLARRVHGSGGVVLESVREFCRKRGIRLEPGPWRYTGGLV